MHCNKFDGKIHSITCYMDETYKKNQIRMYLKLFTKRLKILKDKGDTPLTHEV